MKLRIEDCKFCRLQAVTSEWSKLSSDQQSYMGYRVDVHIALKPLKKQKMWYNQNLSDYILFISREKIRTSGNYNYNQYSASD